MIGIVAIIGTTGTASLLLGCHYQSRGKEQKTAKNVISLKAYITGLFVKNEKIQHIAMGASFGTDERSRR